MHTEHDSIAQYIRALVEAQQKTARAGMPITDTQLVMISTKAMLATQQFPTTNEKWEELGRSAQTRGQWKELLKNRETSKVEVSGRRRTGPVWRSCAQGGRKRSRAPWWEKNPCKN